MRFGAFIAPFHPLNENPTLALERDIELVQLMDKLGYDEAWIGEHHSAGYELIASPELFIATVAERTRNIKLGTGVSSLPYHHPLMLADRINQLDHITRGRVMLGVGPGSLPSDAFMMGITVAKQRDMMDEALDVIVPLLRGEKVTAKTDWFELKDAQLQMTPWSRPSVEIAVASQVSPTGATAAGRHGLGLLSIGATSAGGFNALSSNWAICEDTAKDNGKTIDRSQWRLVGPVHIAEDTGKGARERALRPRTVALLFPRSRGAAARADRRFRPGGCADRFRHGRDRHTGRRHCADRTPAAAVGRLWLLHAARA